MGAVAGIVVACFVALILIIIAIVLLLRQRNGKPYLSYTMPEHFPLSDSFVSDVIFTSSVVVNQRLRDLTGHQKTNQNNGPPVRKAASQTHLLLLYHET